MSQQIPTAPNHVVAFQSEALKHSTQLHTMPHFEFHIFSMLFLIEQKCTLTLTCQSYMYFSAKKSTHTRIHDLQIYKMHIDKNNKTLHV